MTAFRGKRDECEREEGRLFIKREREALVHTLHPWIVCVGRREEEVDVWKDKFTYLP
jgi:hypothetical protein